MENMNEGFHTNSAKEKEGFRNYLDGIPDDVMIPGAADFIDQTERLIAQPLMTPVAAGKEVARLRMLSEQEAYKNSTELQTAITLLNEYIRKNVN